MSFNIIRKGAEPVQPVGASCIGCNCHDFDACITDAGQPCSWLVVDYKQQAGVCSECPEYLEQFDRQYRQGGK